MTRESLFLGLPLIEAWVEERDAWSAVGRTAGLPPSWPLSYVDTAQLIGALQEDRDRLRAALISIRDLSHGERYEAVCAICRAVAGALNG